MIEQNEKEIENRPCEFVSRDYKYLNFIRLVRSNWFRANSLVSSILFLSILALSCENIQEHHLNEGLIELENSRIVGKDLIPGYSIHSVGFFKNDDGTHKLAIRLNSDINEKKVSNYNFGIHIKPTPRDLNNLPKGKNYVSFDFEPQLVKYGDYNYIIRIIKTPIKEIKSIRFFLYNLGAYERTYGNSILLKNIKLY